jgi:hypothetical protein
MKQIIIATIVISLAFSAETVFAKEKEYRPGGQSFASVWGRFYAGDHEPELDDPLIEAGKKMTLMICEAIKNKDMKYRRYAIGALGYIGDKRALPTLENILKSKEEIYYFRGDALHAIYQIDKSFGKKYAAEFGGEHEYLKRLQGSIERDDKWLTKPTEEK